MSTIREAPFFGWCVPQKCVQHPQPTLHQLLFVSTFSSSAISSTKKSQAYHGHSHCILCMPIKPLTITRRWCEIKPASQGGWELLSLPFLQPETYRQLTEAEASKLCLAAKTGKQGHKISMHICWQTKPLGTKACVHSVLHHIEKKPCKSA